MSRRLGLLALAGLSACGGSELARVDLSEVGASVGFVVVFDPEGRLEQVEGPFGVEDGALTFGAHPRVPVGEGRVGLTIVVPQDALAAAVPRWRPEDARALTLAPASEGPTPSVVAEGVVLDVLTLPADTLYWRIEGGVATALPAAAAAPLSARLVLRAPVDHGRCGPARDLVAWDGRGAPLAALADEGFRTSLDRLTVVDAGRLIASSSRSVFVLDRGVPLTTETASRAALRAQDLFPTDGVAQVTGVAVDPTSPPSARRVAIGMLAAETRDPKFQDPKEGAVALVTLTAGGFEVQGILRLDPSHAVRDVAFDARGRLLVTSDGGAAHLYEDVDAAASRPLFYGLDNEDAKRGVATGEPAFPWLVSSRSRISTYSATREAFESDRFGSPERGDVFARGLATRRREDARTEAWAVTNLGQILTRVGRGDWREEALDLPPALGVCLRQAEAVRPELLAELRDVVLTDAYAFVVIEDCTALLVVGLADRCTGVLAIPGPVRAVPRGLSAVDRQADEVVIADQQGRVWAAPLP